MRRARIIGSGVASVVAIAALAAGFPVADNDPDPARAAGAGDTTTALVERRKLVERETVAGRLGYSGAATLRVGVAGTLTRLREEGTVVRRGGWLYEVDGRRTGWVLYGTRPAWRDFSPGMDDGADVRQLEANLRALGYDADRDMQVDGEWDWATTAAVKRFQEARGLEEDGTLDRGEIVFRPDAVRLGEAKAEVGDTVNPGAPLADAGSTRREVTVDLEADRQGLARESALVTVTLPNGRTVFGRIVEVGRVARQGEEDGSATVSVRVRLLGKAGRGGGYDQAPVDVGFERERARGALTVPVTALLARPGGGYAVEVVESGRKRLVPVKPGLTADGLVAVEGNLREGQKVVVPV